MAWGVFFLVVFIGYTGYYVLNVLFDLLRGGTSRAAAGGVHYSLPDLALSEEDPYEVTDEADQEQELDYQDEEYEEEYEEEFEEEFEDEEPYEEPGTGTGPALKVEGQGIPLDEFLRDAKTYAGSIFGD